MIKAIRATCISTVYVITDLWLIDCTNVYTHLKNCLYCFCCCTLLMNNSDVKDLVINQSLRQNADEN